MRAIAYLAQRATRQAKSSATAPAQVMTAPDGRHAALSDDLCICGCHPPPKLIASQNMMSTEA
jgi:hypothetical protein